MSAPREDEFVISPQLREALRYGAVVVTVGPDPDSPEEFLTDFFHIQPDEMPRRGIPAADIADGLRRMADVIEAKGEPL